MCLWEAADGRCIDSVHDKYVHTAIVAHDVRVGDGVQTRLFCIGHYAEIVVIDPTDLYVLFTLCSRVEQDWMCALALMRSVSTRPDVCVALSHAGMVKMWSLTPASITGSTTVDGQPPQHRHIFEDESKQIKCWQATRLVHCAANPRTMLIVASGTATVYDASDLSELTTIVAPLHERWLDGMFVGVDKLALCCSDASTRLYQLPLR